MQPPRHNFGIAVRTTGRMLRTTRYRIPGFICPFYFGGFHVILL